ncbi:MAG TPA: FKBP-type peptidyl-prolyl cis-trans isomerase [Bacteroidia bacterium]|jgi:FKBP-type peptidyl-prolyl cis-trans isomerase FkpA|nr:FKBP-type peptidyl-prolyl cis-trans isomerase [Bacteroidia bacterium]
MKRVKSFLALLYVSVLVSCGNESPAPPRHYTKEQLLTANKVDAHRESDDVDAFVLHHHYDMKSTGTGLRYMFLNHSAAGDSAHSGGYAKVAYKVFLLDGTLCYSSDQDGQREFRVGEDHVESGIHEAVLLMKTGDKLRFILPSNLAHGLLGDGDRIPPRAPVLYEMELVRVR